MIGSSDLLLMVSPPFTIPVFMEVSGIGGFVNLENHPQTHTTGSMKSKLKQKTETEGSLSRSRSKQHYFKQSLILAL
jgi:hypothetical protein